MDNTNLKKQTCDEMKKAYDDVCETRYNGNERDMVLDMLIVLNYLIFNYI